MLGEVALGAGALGEEGSGEGPVGAAEAGAGQPPVWRSVLLLRQLRGTTMILIMVDTTDPASNNNGRGTDGRG